MMAIRRAFSCDGRLIGNRWSQCLRCSINRTLSSAPRAVLPIEKLAFRVGVVLRAWPHPESEKLWCQEIDVGDDDDGDLTTLATRTIASGIRAHYAEPSDLEGRRVVVATNLKPRKIAGFVSQGMVLCASKAVDGRDSVELVEVPVGADIGERITFPEFSFSDDATFAPALKLSGNQSNKLWKAVATKLTTNDAGVACYDGSPFTTSAGLCTAATLTDARVT